MFSPRELPAPQHHAGHARRPEPSLLVGNKRQQRIHNERRAVQKQRGQHKAQRLSCAGRQQHNTAGTVIIGNCAAGAGKDVVNDYALHGMQRVYAEH